MTTFRNALDRWQIIECEGDTCTMWDEDERTHELYCVGTYANPEWRG